VVRVVAAVAVGEEVKKKLIMQECTTINDLDAIIQIRDFVNNVNMALLHPAD
jgi:hypothetical protein